MALTTDRNTLARDAKEFEYPVEGATKLHAGGMSCLNSSGNLVPGSTALGLTCVGRQEVSVDNSGGVAGEKTGRVRRGCFNFKNSAGGDEITLADVGNACFIVDDETVAKTDGTSTRSQAGIVRDVDQNGVWVEF